MYNATAKVGRTPMQRNNTARKIKKIIMNIKKNKALWIKLWEKKYAPLKYKVIYTTEEVRHMQELTSRTKEEAGNQ